MAGYRWKILTKCVCDPDDRTPLFNEAEWAEMGGAISEPLFIRALRVNGLDDQAMRRAMGN
jgi:hypothetical protein